MSTIDRTTENALRATPPETQADRLDQTTDALFDGALTLFQDARGYRFSIDAVLLAGTARTSPNARVLDLGCGCGVVGLAIAHLFGPRRVVGLDMQARLVALARRNVELNGLGDIVQVVHGDVREQHEAIPPGSFELVVCNPPYHPPKEGRINPDEQRAAARHALHGEVSDFLAAARTALAPRGMLHLVYPAFRLEALMTALRRARLRLEWIQFVRPKANATATLVLVAARRDGAPRLIVRPDIVLHDEAGHTPFVSALLAGSAPRYPGEVGGDAAP